MPSHKINKKELKLQKMVLKLLQKSGRPLTMAEIRQRLGNIRNLGSVIDKLLENGLIDAVVYEKNGKYVIEYKLNKQRLSNFLYFKVK